MNLHLLRTFVNGSPDCIAVLDRTLTFVVANPSYCAEFARIYGRPLAVGESLRTAFADLPEQLQRAEEVIQRGLTGDSFHLQIEAGLAEMGRTLYEFAIHPVLDDTGEIVGVAQIVRPAAKRDQRLDMLLESARAGMWTWNPTSGRVHYDRRQALLLGLNPTRAPTLEDWCAAIIPDDRAAVAAALERFAANPETPLKIDYRVGHPADPKWLRTCGGQDNSGGRDLSGLLGITIDITDVRHLESALADARKNAAVALIEAERSALAKSQFFAAVSHDLRQPAQSLLLLSSLLKLRAEGTPLADLAEPLDLAVGALKQLLDGVLDIARLDAGMVKAQEENVAVGEIIRRLAFEFGDRAAELGLEFHFVDTGVKVRADPVLFERILRQYLENALRFTPKGRILLGCRRRGGQCSVEVLDTGIGIADHERETIFEEFYQVGNVSRDRSLGLGLGLAVVRRLAEIIGADVAVTSIPGRGSRFAIILPLASTSGGGLAEGIPAYSHLPSSGAVMVIEEDGMVLAGLRLLLERWGYLVATASTGEQAARLAAHGMCPNFILASYRLAGKMNGSQAVDAVRRACGQSIKALLIADATEAGLQADFQDDDLVVLYKPVRMETLRSEVLRLVRLA